MTYLVSDKHKMELYNDLNALSRIAEDLKGLSVETVTDSYRIVAVLNRLRQNIGRWAALHVYDDAGNELHAPDASFFAECDIHGLFAIEGVAKVADEDCPVCLRELEEEDHLDLEKEIDYVADQRVDREIERDEGLRSMEADKEVDRRRETAQERMAEVEQDVKADYAADARKAAGT